jgi:hypothetical protein
MKRLLISGAAVAAVLALAACGGGSGGALSLDPVASAAEKTAKQGSARVHFTMSGGGIKGTGTGLFDNDGSAGRMSMDVQARGKSVHMDAVTQGFVIYLKSPLFQSQPGLPKGKEWVKIDIKKAAKSLGVDFDSLQSMSPGSGLSVLRGSSGSPTKVGKETVAGVSTTHYRTRIDLEAAANKAKGETAKTLHKLVELTGQKTISVEAWIDGNGLVRKESYSQRFSPGQPLVKITQVMYDFGRRVSIPAPPSDKVFDATNLAGS